MASAVPEDNVKMRGSCTDSGAAALVCPFGLVCPFDLVCPFAMPDGYSF